MSSQKSTTTRSALADELILYTTRQEGEKVGFSYEAECTVLKTVTLTLNFDGSVNFVIDDYGGNSLSETAGTMCLKAVIRPFTRHFMGRLAIADKYKRASLKMGCSWSLQDAADNETDSYMHVHVARIQKEITNSKTVGYPREVFDPTLIEIRRLYDSSGQMFVDSDFPPVEVSLYKVASGSSNATTSTAKAVKHPPIEWKRAHEFLVTGSVTACKVFEGAIEPADIRQGALGDCWFLCALASIAEFPQLVRHLFLHLKGDANNHGAYAVQFCKMGIWTPIRVDDFFPCYPGGGAIYSRGHGPEMWVLLLEKAFAKYCGSYEAIKSGWAFEAMMDLTGAPFENYRFSDADVAEDIKSGKLWNMLELYDSEGSLISASTPGEDVWTEFGKKPGKEVTTGLVAGHAYTIIKVKRSKYGPRIVKLRNPWGSMEWTGDWSDKSPLWTKEMQDEIEQLVTVDDGTFWMSYEDLVKFFSGINICMVRGISSPPWHEARRRFFYTVEGEDNNNKVVSNNYVLTVSEPGGVFFVSVHQQDVRCSTAPPYVDIGVTILQEKEQHSVTVRVDGASDESRKHDFIGGSGIAAARQTQFKIELSPGTYIVAPITTGCKLKAQVELSNLKKGSTPQKKLLITDAAGQVVEFTDDVYRVYTEIFHFMDVDTDGFLSKEELDHFMVLTEGKKVSDEAFAWLVANFGEKRGISLSGFLRAQLYVLKQLAANEEKLRAELALLGYGDDLTVSNRRAASLVIHSATADFTLKTRHYDPVVYEDATELVIRKKGKVTAYDGGKVLVYVLKSGYDGVSFLIENTSSHPLVVQCDCSKSKNVVSHRGKLSHEETIAPGADVVMHHLMPANDREGWSWTYSLSYAFDD